MELDNELLLASSSTIEGIIKLINDFYYSKNISLKENIENKTFEIYNLKGVINNVLVYKKGKRFKFVSFKK